MNTKTKRLILAALLGAATVIPTQQALADNEFGSNTPYYEDDAWYDISEWFDGNDYNPTDEAIGRWDNERFEFTDNLNSTDQDNDWNSYADYGYKDNSPADSGWFYDYYDDGYGHWGSNFYTSFYDTDDDGLYDSYASYTDHDDDGFYEEFDFVVLDADSKDQSVAEEQVRAKQKSLKSSPRKISGVVEKTKMTKVRGRIHLIASVKSKDGKATTIDLGPGNTDTQLFEGDELTATGYSIRVGEKDLVVAVSAVTPAGNLYIDRNGRKYTGTIEKLKTVQVRGKEHHLAKLKTAEGKTMMIDMGKMKDDNAMLKKGQQITVQGIPTKIGERVVLMARRVMADDKTHVVDRQFAINKQ